jgi:hypothetical protein
MRKPNPAMMMIHRFEAFIFFLPWRPLGLHTCKKITGSCPLYTDNDRIDPGLLKK